MRRKMLQWILGIADRETLNADQKRYLLSPFSGLLSHRNRNFTAVFTTNGVTSFFISFIPLFFFAWGQEITLVARNGNYIV
jgi:hypothetical protein